MGKPVVVKTKLLKNMVLREFYELVAATEVNFWKLLAYIKSNITMLMLFCLSGKQ